MNEDLKKILIKKGLNKCRNCNKKIDEGDCAWNNADTEYGTPYCWIEIQCQQCDTEVISFSSWYPHIEDIGDLIKVIDDEIDDKMSI